MSARLKTGYVSNLNPPSWKPINRTTFSKWINDTFTKKDLMNLDDGSETCKLFDYQQFIKNFLQYSSPYRGVLVYHGLGTGKSRTSISIAEVLSSEMDIVLLLPASLEQNYIGEIQKCGNKLYSYQKHWEFVAQKDLKKYDVPADFFVPIKTLKAFKGCWIPVSLEANFDSLNELARSQIIAQVDETVRNRYEFIHYNGISMAKVEAMDSTFFDNKVIIIDEVHNFISRVSNSVATSIAFRLYLMMLNAVNCKLVLLSGTPIINKPIELAYLANLTRGFLSVAKLKYNSNTKLGNIGKFLDQHKNIDYYDIDESSGNMSFVFSPPGFEFVESDMLKRSKDEILTNSEMLIALKEELEEKFKVPFIDKSVIKKYQLFPTKEEVFDDIFIDYDNKTNPIKNSMMLSRRLQGITSYFESYDPELYPLTSDIELVDIPMENPTHIQKYVTVRMDEIKKEQRAIKNKKNARFENSFGNVYRAFSRALCNFCFPESITRFYPSDISKLKELDQVDYYKADDGLEDNDISGGASLNAQQYEIHKTKIMSQLRAQQDKYLVGENLKNCSPKYFEIIKKINETKGLALVYSQFREVEGLGVFQLALEANGFEQFKLKKHGKEWEIGNNFSDKPKYVVFDSSDREQTRALVDIFNSDWDNYKNISDAFAKHKNLHGDVIKVIMITQSGAEGISLKNVRQVHIMEPYWNKIRIKQVIGRAVRAGSHLALPKNERQVSVFLYRMNLDTKKLLKTETNAKDIIKYDGGKTSDEHIWELATKKALIVDSLLNIVKENAIDCELHKKQHNIKCFKVPSNFGGIKQLIYKNEPIDQDETDESLKKKIVVKEKTVLDNNDIDNASFGFIRKLNDRLPYNRNTMKVYDPVLFSQGVYEIIGFIIAEDGKARVGFLKDKYFPQ